MICKISRCANLPAILGYNFAKQARSVAYIIDSQFMPKCEDTPPLECQRIIGLWGSRNATCEKRFVHINVNPAPQDWKDGKMSEELLKQIGREYLESMGFGDQPYVMLIHKDKSPDRWHAHIVTTCIRIDGTRISDQNEKRRSMNVVRDLERKHCLWNATQKREVKAQEVKRVYYSDGNVRRKISDVVELARSYNYKSFGQFRAILNRYGVSCKLVQRFQGGKMRSGLVYFCIDERGRQVGKCFPANQLHRCGIKDTIGHLDVGCEYYPIPGWLQGAAVCDDTDKLRYLLKNSGVVPVVGDHGITYLLDEKDRNVYEFKDNHETAATFAGIETDSFEELCEAVNHVIACYMVGSIAVVDSETSEQKKRRKRRMGR